MDISLDQQIVNQHCPSCRTDFTVVRGTIYVECKQSGLYLIALHGHSPDGRLGHLAISLLDGSIGQSFAQAAAIDVISTSEQFGFKLKSWSDSPWLGESYLGEMLAPDEVRGSALRSTFFQVAERIVSDLPEVQTYFA